MFRVGMKVVCIRDDWEPDDPKDSTDGPIKGRVYKIDDMNFAPHWLGFPEWPGYIFLADHFRPVVEPKTDIRVFEEIARRASQTGLVDA